MASAAQPLPHRPFLDRLRWVSAVIVAFGHAVAVLNSAHAGNGVLALVASLREQAVYIFFVVSGYLVGGQVLSHIAAFDFLGYAVARFTRIYSVLIPAVILTSVLLLIVMFIDPQNPIYAEVWQGGGLSKQAVFDRLTPMHWLSTLTSFEPFLGPPIGSAGVFWNLGYEWVFYFTFPLICLLGFFFYKKKGLYIAIGLSVAISAVLNPLYGCFFAIWVMGALASQVKLGMLIKARGWQSALKALFLCLMLVCLIFGRHLSHGISVLATGAFGSLFLACDTLWEDRFMTAFDKPLADISYSLYATHLQLQIFATAILIRLGVVPVSGIEDPLRVLIIAIAYLLLSFPMALAFGWLFERHYKPWSVWLKARLIEVFGRKVRPL